MSTKSKNAIAKRAALYLRVSTEGQVGRDGDPEGASIPAQREKAAQRAAELGADVVAEESDPGFSGRTDKRPGLQRLLHRIRTVGDIDYVIVWKLSRLSRSPLLDATLELELRERGVKLVSVTEHIDETPGGELLKRVLGVINAYEVDNLSERRDGYCAQSQARRYARLRTLRLRQLSPHRRRQGVRHHRSRFRAD